MMWNLPSLAMRICCILWGNLMLISRIKCNLIFRRNLADNFNIDIASELEEYLQELEKITFSIDGVGKTLNFAEGTWFTSSPPRML